VGIVHFKSSVLKGVDVGREGVALDLLLLGFRNEVCVQDIVVGQHLANKYIS